MPTFQKIANDYVRQFSNASNAFNVVDTIAADMKKWTRDGKPLDDAELRRIIELIRAGILQQGGMPTRIREGSNAGSIDLISLLAAKLGLK